MSVRTKTAHRSSDIGGGDLHRAPGGGGGSQTAGAGRGVGGEEVRSASADRPSEKCSSEWRREVGGGNGGL